MNLAASPTPKPAKICPIIGILPNAAPAPGISTTANLAPTGAGLQMAPCVQERCGLWDNLQNQCCYLTQSQNLQQVNDTLFQTLKVTSQLLKLISASANVKGQEN